MYEDIGGRIDIDNLQGDTVLKELHTFMDAYQCYHSRPMRLRLQALILESSKIGPGGIIAEAPHFIPIGKGLQSPDIYTCATRAAALGYYFSQRENSKHPYLERHCIEDTMEILKFWAAKIAKEYDPIVHELDRFASTAIAQLQVHNKDPTAVGGASRLLMAARTWTYRHREELSSLTPYDPAKGTCVTQNWLWGLYTHPTKIEIDHERCELCPCTDIRENIEFLLTKAREIISPLYRDMWRQESRLGNPSVGKMLNSNFDPVPCIQKELAEAAKSIVKEGGPCLMISVGGSVEIVPEKIEERARRWLQEQGDTLRQLGWPDRY